MKYLFLYLSITILIVLIGCKKDRLTKETHKGANTFSCKVNGQIFKPEYEGGLFNDVKVLSVRNNAQYGFSIDADNQSTSESIGLENPYITQTGTYILKADYPNRGVYSRSIPTPIWVTTDSFYMGKLVITRCDLEKKIYSGTFSFVAFDPNTGKVITVTDGRFDVKE